MVETLDIGTLTSAQEALGAVRPPLVLREGEASHGAGPLRVIGTGEEQASLGAVNALGVAVDAVSCRFVRDVTVLGSGYLMHGERVVTDGSHLSDVAVEWVGRPMPDSPVAVKPASERFVDGLAVVGIGPGHLIYGHWLVDFIPRFVAAKAVLGDEFRRARLVLPDDTPGWGVAMLEAFTGSSAEQYVFYTRGVERIALHDACVPSYVHTDYHFHSYAKEVFAGVGAVAAGGGRKLCISRAGFERATHGVQKLFGSRRAFEAMAERHGYEVVMPETMGLREQAALFASASHVVGEYGSALHSAVFSPPGLRVGMIRCPNAIQLRIAALWGHSSVVVLPEDDRVAATGVQEYTLTDSEMTSFFEANEA